MDKQLQRDELISTGSINVKDIYQSARIAQKTIAQFSLVERVQMLERMRDYIIQHQESIVTKVQDETNKCLSDTFIGEIFGVLEHLDYLIKNAPKILGEKKIHTPLAMFGKKSRLFTDPLGVILIISPWNYPFYQAIVPITSAFITGNAVIYKPSEITPLKGLIEEILLHAFRGAGSWAQVIYGDGKVGAQLVKGGPDKIFFTGSVNTGKKIMKEASETLTPVELELGGKDPMIVFEDANIYRAVKGAIWGAMTNCGQSCTSVERLYLHESIYSDFKSELVKQVNKLTQGVDKDGSSDIGEMTSLAQIEIIKSHLEDALSKGAIQLTGQSWDKKSQAIPPIVLDNVNNSMLVATEETFGPILPLFKFETQEEVIRLANDSVYGLTASVWSEDTKRAAQVAHQLECGGVSINNVMITEGNHALPFGGVKNSGIGRYKGEIGLYSFCNLKSIIIDGGHNKTDANWYPYTAQKYKLFQKMTFGLLGGRMSGLKDFALHGLKLESLSNKLGKKASED